MCSGFESPTCAYGLSVRLCVDKNDRSAGRGALLNIHATSTATRKRFWLECARPSPTVLAALQVAAERWVHKQRGNKNKQLVCF